MSERIRENIENYMVKCFTMPGLKDASILEIGTGNVLTNRYLFEKDNRFYTSDIRELGWIDILVDIEGAIDRTMYHKYDLVILSEVLEHTFNYMKVLQNVKRLLKDGGLAVITVPFEYQEHEDGEVLDYWRFTERCIDRLLLECRFEVIDSDGGFDGDKKTNIFRLIKINVNKQV